MSNEQPKKIKILLASTFNREHFGIRAGEVYAVRNEMQGHAYYGFLIYTPRGKYSSVVIYKHECELLTH